MVLMDKSLDKAFIAEMLALPSESVLGQKKTPVAVDGIHTARKYVVSELAYVLKDELLSTYQACLTDDPYEFTPEATGQRRLKNMVLGYLMEIADENIFTMVGTSKVDPFAKKTMSKFFARAPWLLTTFIGGIMSALLESYSY